MRVAVIGAGIVGVTTAFELARDGHPVTVFERRGSVAEETSFANAGVVAPGYFTPPAAPEVTLIPPAVVPLAVACWRFRTPALTVVAPV